MFKWIKEWIKGTRGVIKAVRNFINRYYWLYQIAKPIVTAAEKEVDKEAKHTVVFNAIIEQIEQENIVIKNWKVNLVIEIAVMIMEFMQNN